MRAGYCEQPASRLQGFDLDDEHVGARELTGLRHPCERGASSRIHGQNRRGLAPQMATAAGRSRI